MKTIGNILKFIGVIPLSLMAISWRFDLRLFILALALFAVGYILSEIITKELTK